MDATRRNFQRIWKQDRRYLGAKGMPAPTLMFSKKGQGNTATGTTDRTDVATPGLPRAIQLGPSARRQLKQLDVRGRDPSGVRYAIEHEFGRYFGPDQPLASPDGNAGAGLANAVANRLARIRNTQGPQRQVAIRKMRRYSQKHLPYVGQNPQTIRWPSQ